MPVLPPQTREDSMQESQILRLELKEWERSFAASNAGRKASREDIKQHPEIAEKYKVYSKLRAASSSQSPSYSIAPPKPKPKPNRQLTHTPQNLPKQTYPLHPSALDIYDHPLSAQKTPTPRRTFIGPTPQKDGRVLGLFDLLSPASNPAPTPSKQARNTLNLIHSNIVVTPSKRLADATEDAPWDHHNYILSAKRLQPTSSSALNGASFLTPSSHRVATAALSQTTPNSSRGGVSKLKFDDTPAFLRRDSQRAHSGQEQKTSLDGENDDANGDLQWSPFPKVRMPARQLAGKGLSALVRNLREMEDERLDEELDLLHELDGPCGATVPNPTALCPKSKTLNPTLRPSTVCVADRQGAEMPLGPDGTLDSESEEEAEKGHMGGTRRWKKRGQKRSTRMVVMKPSRGKWKPEPLWGGEEPGEGDGDEDEAVLETQPTHVGVEGEDLLLYDDEGGEKGDENVKGEEKEKKKTVYTLEQKAPAEGEPPAKLRKKKKLAATANANFRALKIRSRGSGGGKGRFGRRR